MKKTLIVITALPYLQFIFLFVALFLITKQIFKRFETKYSFFSKDLMWCTYVYHLLFGLIYYLYALSNPSDSKKYFSKTFGTLKNWGETFGTETTFVRFFSYPFIKYFHFNYEMMMLLFTWIGFMGFFFAYLFFKENVNLKVTIFKRINLLTLILFLPNMHFWSASLGKGSLIFFGLMLFAYTLNKPQKRFLPMILASMLVFAVRPHIFLFLAIAIFYGLMFGRNRMPLKLKLGGMLILIASLFLLKEQILGVVKLNGSENPIQDFLAFASHRSEDLSDTASGLNMNNYSILERICSFWFRPLFFDAPGILGVFVSLENLVYIILFSRLFRLDFFTFWKTANTNVKMSMVLFLVTSVAMTFIMSNLGIMIRQKSMIMYFLLFVIYYYQAFLNGQTTQVISQKVKTTIE